jgi:hypothetical protein
MASENRMISEYRVGNYVDESGRVIIYITFLNFALGKGELKKRMKCSRISGLRLILEPGTSQIRNRRANHSKLRLDCSRIGGRSRCRIEESR